MKFAEYECIAGVPAGVIEAREKGGSRIPAVRSSLFSVTTADPKLASQIEPIEGDIKDRGNSDYRYFASKTAGPVEVVVTGNSEEAVYDSVLCGDYGVLKCAFRSGVRRVESWRRWIVAFTTRRRLR